MHFNIFIDTGEFTLGGVVYMLTNDHPRSSPSCCPRFPLKASRPSVRPNKEVAQALGAGELVWNLTVCEKQETSVIAALLT